MGHTPECVYAHILKSILIRYVYANQFQKSTRTYYFYAHEFSILTRTYYFYAHEFSILIRTRTLKNPYIKYRTRTPYYLFDDITICQKYLIYRTYQVKLPPLELWESLKQGGVV